MNKFFFSAFLVALFVGAVFQISNSPDQEIASVEENIQVKKQSTESERKPASKPKALLPEAKKERLRQEVIKKYIDSKTNRKDISQTFSKKPMPQVLSTREFKLKGQSLFIASNAKAVPSYQYHSGMGRKIASVNSHVIYNGKHGLPVVQDPVKLRKGVATGHIIVTAEPNVDLTSLAREHNLEVHHTVPHLNLISFIPRESEKLLETSVALSKSSLVKSVKLDISYGGPRAK